MIQSYSRVYLFSRGAWRLQDLGEWRNRGHSETLFCRRDQRQLSNFEVGPGSGDTTRRFISQVYAWFACNFMQHESIYHFQEQLDCSKPCRTAQSKGFVLNKVRIRRFLVQFYVLHKECALWLSSRMGQNSAHLWVIRSPSPLNIESYVNGIR